MPVLAAFALANLKHDLGSLWTWLSHRSFWQLVSMALAGFALVQHFELAHSRKEAVNYRIQRDGYKAQLDGISSKRNDQKAETQTRIVTVTKLIHDAEGKARKIETAPLPGNCRTPDAVRQADL